MTPIDFLISGARAKLLSQMPQQQPPQPQQPQQSMQQPPMFAQTNPMNVQPAQYMSAAQTATNDFASQLAALSSAKLFGQ